MLFALKAVCLKMSEIMSEIGFEIVTLFRNEVVSLNMLFGN